MEINAKILEAKVMHKRLSPQMKAFTYGLYYLVLPIHQLHHKGLNKALAINRFSTISFYEKDHGHRDNQSLTSWIMPILKENELHEITDHVLLVTLPRILGYTFNPVSFWLCLDNQNQLRSVLCEVNNTFGETHSYLCTHHNKNVIKKSDTLSTKKLFFVSPFLEREGRYEFTFSYQDDKLGIWIDFFDKNNHKQLITSLTGNLSPLTKGYVRKMFWKYPLVTLKTIGLIHWQAIKLINKKIKRITKPKQYNKKLS